jgi:hypothetical protein
MSPPQTATPPCLVAEDVRDLTLGGKLVFVEGRPGFGAGLPRWVAAAAAAGINPAVFAEAEAGPAQHPDPHPGDAASVAATAGSEGNYPTYQGEALHGRVAREVKDVQLASDDDKKSVLSKADIQLRALVELRVHSLGTFCG